MSKRIKKLLITISIIPSILLMHIILDNVVSTNLGGYIIRIMAEGVLLLGVAIKATVDGVKIIVSKIKENKQNKIKSQEVDLEVVDEAECLAADEKLKQELSITSTSKQQKDKAIKQNINLKEKDIEK